jgi:hypothetical protein
MPQLPPLEVADLLQARADFLTAEIASLDTLLQTLIPRIGRIVLLETELARAWKQTELEWVQRLAEDLRNGVYHWDIDEILRTGVTPGLRVGHPTTREGDESMT